MITVRNVSKTFGTVQAVRNVNVDIAAGEFFALLGASGSGKTTLLRMIAGFEGVTSGQILIDGQEMQDVPPHLRPINMVFQNYAIFPHLNVRDNIAYGLRSLGTPAADKVRMVDEMLDLIALPSYGDRRASQLSGGQMQRVALARALILKPKVLLLDEPLGALDKQLREQMQLELRGLQRRLGITFVLVTHDQEEALTLADRVAVMANGEVVQVDSPAGLYDRPHNRMVASFVGTMNFLDATVCGDETDPKVEIAGLGKVRVMSAQGKLTPGRRVLAAIRPEALTASLESPGDTVRSLRGNLQARQYLGGRQLLHVTVEGCDAPIAIASPALAGQDPWSGADGKPVWLCLQTDAVTILDTDKV